jgi:hypothetical protein
MIGSQIHHEYADKFENKNYIKEFNDIYNPKHLVTEKQVQFEFNGFNHTSQESDMPLDENQSRMALFRMYSQWYSVKMAYSFIVNPSEYTYIIRLRTDSYISKPINLMLLPSSSHLYVQSGRCAGRDRKLCDWFAVGNYSTMSLYCNIFDYLQKYYKNGIIHMHKFIECIINDLHIQAVEYEFGVPISHSYYKNK